MRIQHNISAINANRQLGINNNSVSKNLEKLSSGYKINRAGDDAAGLAISEKMRSQIRGLDQASSNANDGISLVQTAEGALNETQSILQRMKELATQSSNGTYQNDVDRENIGKEVEALKSEIDRISTSTNFNKINLLDGSLSAKGAASASAIGKVEGAATGDVAAVAGVYASSAALQGGAKAGESMSFSIGLDNGKSYTTNFTVVQDQTGTTGKLIDANGKEYGTVADVTAGVTAGEASKAIVEALKGTGLANEFNIAAPSDIITLTAKTAGTSAPKVVSVAEVNNGTAESLSVNNSTVATDAGISIANGEVSAYDGTSATKAEDATFSINGKKFALVTAGTVDASVFGKDVTVLTGADLEHANLSLIEKQTGLTMKAETGKGIQLFAGTATSESGALKLQIGASASKDQQVSLSIGDMSSKGLGINGISVATQDDALESIQTIEDAINQVSGTRADLGALQNRLEHTVNNLGVTSENLTSAESRVRDVDMAKEMMEMTKNNVLTQAAQSMLAQANQQPQNVLKLLQ
ncbi:MAG: flagellin [Clostridium sp.]|uniref:flagellin N-terminal helical domain-containing protein n=1 Tax=Clostridium sp. TaxID=1506 RepID=UPI00290B58D5|nr:flagellin [Clostridium sp.]MDU7336978.1 flagellin [Clostridium sp.]